MSYGIITPCWNCKKNDICQDSQKISNATHEMYKEPDTHKGAGNIILSCCKMSPKTE